MSQIRGSEHSQHNQAKHSGRNILGMVFPGCWAHTFAVNHVFLQWVFQQHSLSSSKASSHVPAFPIHVPLLQLLIFTCPPEFPSVVFAQQCSAAGQNTLSYTPTIKAKSTVPATVFGLAVCKIYLH